jgi:hypothetical protein
MHLISLWKTGMETTCDSGNELDDALIKAYSIWQHLYLDPERGWITLIRVSKK